MHIYFEERKLKQDKLADQVFGSEYKTYRDRLQSIRPGIKQTHKHFPERKKRWYEVVDSVILELIRGNRLEEARDLLQEITEIKELPAVVETAVESHLLAPV